MPNLAPDPLSVTFLQSTFIASTLHTPFNDRSLHDIRNSIISSLFSRTHTHDHNRYFLSHYEQRLQLTIMSAVPSSTSSRKTTDPKSKSKPYDRNPSIPAQSKKGKPKNNKSKDVPSEDNPFQNFFIMTPISERLDHGITTVADTRAKGKATRSSGKKNTSLQAGMTLDASTPVTVASLKDASLESLTEAALHLSEFNAVEVQEFHEDMMIAMGFNMNGYDVAAAVGVGAGVSRYREVDQDDGNDDDRDTDYQDEDGEDEGVDAYIPDSEERVTKKGKGKSKAGRKGLRITRDFLDFDFR